MFDSVLDRGNVPKSRFGAGTVISVVVHVALIAGAIWISTNPPEADELEREVKFVAAPPPPPPPPPKGSSKPKTEKKIKKEKPKTPEKIVQPMEIPIEKPPSRRPAARSSTPARR
jgi:protein TonB